jgi:hypothetical protein
LNRNNILDLSSKSILPKEFLLDLDNIAEELRSHYVNVISDINIENIKDIDWLVTDLSCRNTANCTLFENICKLELVNRLISRNHIDQVLTNCPFLYKAIVKNFGKKYVVQSNFIFFYKYIQLLINNSKKFIALFYHYLSRYLISKIYAVKPNFDINQPLIVLESIIYENSFDNLVFKDRHYPGLLDNVTDSDKSRVFILPYYYGIFNYVRLFKKLKKTDTSFLIPENFLTLSDYLYALFSFLRKFKKVKNINNIDFINYDITDLFLNSYFENFISIGSCEGLIRNRLIFRLYFNGVRLGKYIQWFENQPINRGAIIGLKSFYPFTKISGHIGFFTSPNVVGLYPSNQELVYNLLPDEISVIGKKLVDSISIFCPKLNTKLSPAFRFQHLLFARNEVRRDKKFTILIILPIFKDEYTRVLDLFALAKSKFSNFDLLLKTHPGANQEVVFKKLKDTCLIDFKTNKNTQDA